MGINNLTDKEIQTIISKKGGLGEFLKDKQNLARFIGLDSSGKRRLADIMQHEGGMSKADIKRKFDEAAMIHTNISDFFF